MLFIFFSCGWVVVSVVAVAFVVVLSVFIGLGLSSMGSFQHYKVFVK
jgi:hypothetical protein